MKYKGLIQIAVWVVLVLIFFGTFRDHDGSMMTFFVRVILAIFAASFMIAMFYRNSRGRRR